MSFRNSGIGLSDVAVGEIDERLPHPPHRVEHVHRALQNVRQVPPADIFEIALVQRIDVAVAASEIERDRAGQRQFSGGRIARTIVLISVVLPQLDSPASP
jgi:hypothetical protein